MTTRKPGDYVVNAELTDTQRQRFVDDCVAAGYGDEGDAFEEGWTITRLGPCSRKVGGHEDLWLSIFSHEGNNVTHHYQHQTIDTQRLKTDPAYWDEVAPGMAQYFYERTADWYRRKDGGIYAWVDGEGWENAMFPGRIRDAIKRPEPTTDILTDLLRRVAHLEAQLSEAGRSDGEVTERVPTEDDVGRLVLVRNAMDDPDECEGPHVLDAVDDDKFPYITPNGACWEYAKLYEGPTRPNWIKHDGQSVPIHGTEQVLFEKRNGDMATGQARAFRWDHRDQPGDIVRYTIINP